MMAMNPIESARLRLGFGHAIVSRGDVLEITACVAREGSIREVQYCYTDLPVYVDGKAMFRATSSHIAVPNSNRVDCRVSDQSNI